MEKKVTVLTPNGRRYQIKVTPNTTLLQILEQACQKGGFNPDEYNLTHHNKPVSLAQMFGFSGLPNNCLLEMAEAEVRRVASNVDICVQLEDGSREQGQFEPGQNLWQVVEQLSGPAVSNYKSPVAIYMRQEIVGRAEIEKTTLKSLGITAGRAMIRFVDKKPEDLKTQANVYKASEVTKVGNVESDAKPQSAKGGRSAGGRHDGGFAITKDIVKSLKNEEPRPSTSKAASEAENAKKAREKAKEQAQQDKAKEKPKYDWGSGQGHRISAADPSSSRDAKALTAKECGRREEEEMEVEPAVTVIGERNAILYSLDCVQKEIEELPDSFYELTVTDLKLVLRDLKKVAAGSEDAPLITKELRRLEEDKARLRKIATYRHCVIRIRFPDHYVLQGTFKPSDKVADIMEFVRKFVTTPNGKFQLFTIPPKRVLAAQDTLLDLDFVPTALVHFEWEDEKLRQQKESAIKPEYLKQLTSPEGALFAAHKVRANARRASVELTPSFSTNNYDYDQQPGPSTGAIPKRPRNGF